MYFCIFEKINNQKDIIWFFKETLAFIDIKNGIELYKLKQEITHIEEKFEEYKLNNSNCTYRLDIKSYNPANNDILNRKEGIK